MVYYIRCELRRVGPDNAPPKRKGVSVARPVVEYRAADFDCGLLCEGIAVPRAPVAPLAVNFAGYDVGAMACACGCIVDIFAGFHWGYLLCFLLYLYYSR